eukprot:gb/GFBE01061413.1/.p1 GENE.gb/GFBE01061413.1/~~gb/GFBE01061413.1/.p1  ORF type:complete len:363 (+),score=83.23 gb/GFBE01061413.1/:1-1089(+)
MPVRRQSTRTARCLGVAAVVGFGVNHWMGPGYAVKGSWEGAPSTLKDREFDSVLKGLEPTINLPPITFKREGLALSVEDGRLLADYVSKFGDGKTFQLRVNDEQDWRAGLSTDDASLRVRGHGPNLDNLFWEASQQGHADGVGEVLLEFNSDKAYNLTVAQANLAQVLGADLGARVQATNDGVTGRLDAERRLGDVMLRYSVENPVGVYDLGKSTHVGEIAAGVAGGDATLRVTSEDSAQRYEGSYKRSVQGGQADLQLSYKDEALGYNVSYSRGLNDVLPVDSDVHLGADESGVYGRLAARRNVGEGLDAEYEARARLGIGEENSADLAHSLKLSSKLGFAQLLHGSDTSPRLRVGYEFNA